MKLLQISRKNEIVNTIPDSHENANRSASQTLVFSQHGNRISKRHSDREWSTKVIRDDVVIKEDIWITKLPTEESDDNSYTIELSVSSHSDDDIKEGDERQAVIIKGHYTEDSEKKCERFLIQLDEHIKCPSKTIHEVKPVVTTKNSKKNPRYLGCFRCDAVEKIKNKPTHEAQKELQKELKKEAWKTHHLSRRRRCRHGR